MSADVAPERHTRVFLLHLILHDVVVYLGARHSPRVQKDLPHLTHRIISTWCAHKCLRIGSSVSSEERKKHDLSSPILGRATELREVDPSDQPPEYSESTHRLVGWIARNLSLEKFCRPSEDP